MKASLRAKPLGSFSLSPDGTRVAAGVADEGGNVDIRTLAFARNVMTRLTSDPNPDQVPVWSPDGRYIAYDSSRGGSRQIFRTESGGGGQHEQLTRGLRDLIDMSVTDWSRREVYVRAFPPGPGSPWQISNQGGTRPKWRDDGRELYYLSPVVGQQMGVMAAAVRVSESQFPSETPRELFRIPAVSNALISPYDVTDHGQRFLVMRPTASAAGPPPLTVVTDWRAGLAHQR